MSRDGLSPVLTPEEILSLRAIAAGTLVSDPLVDYVHRIAEATRRHPALRLGASPRGAIGVKATAQGLALLLGRDHVVPGDVRAVAPAVLCHRVFLKGAPGAEPGAEAAQAVISEILEAVPAPI